MASNQLSNKRGKHGGKQVQSGYRGESSPEHVTHDFGSKVHEAYEEAGDYLSQGASQVRDLTRDHEGTAVVIALAAGLGIGLTIGSALAMQHRRPKSWRESISAERVGRKMLDRLEGMIPDALAEYLRK